MSGRVRVLSAGECAASLEERSMSHKSVVLSDEYSVVSREDVVISHEGRDVSREAVDMSHEDSEGEISEQKAHISAC